MCRPCPSALQSDLNSLWLMGNALIASGRELVSNHIRIANATGKNFTLNRDWQYVINNGPASVTAGYRYSLNGMVLRTWDSVGRVNMLGIGLLIAEGAVVCGIAALYMWVLLKQVARQRYSLYSVFLVIPTGFLRALASKHVQVDGEDDNDSDSDAGDDANANKERNKDTAAVPGAASTKDGKTDDGKGDDKVGTALGSAMSAIKWLQDLHPEKVRFCSNLPLCLGSRFLPAVACHPSWRQD